MLDMCCNTCQSDSCAVFLSTASCYYPVFIQYHPIWSIVIAHNYVLSLLHMLSITLAASNATM